MHETVTSLPNRQCPEQGRFFFSIGNICSPGLCPWSYIYIYIHQDFVLGGTYVYIYIYIVQDFVLGVMYVYIYIYWTMLT